ncbi:MAG TPA: Lrp/AsnC family transcriptional regulator, partial [Mucilaginibacter sp.]|nr:Lrp/AsnC family transcriptional regulator [Mucilaginibacter sp.]
MPYELDDIDKNILKLLQEDARLSNKQLAHLLHRSPNPVYIRVKRLEEEGYIKRYAAIVDPKKIGRGLIAYTQVHVDKHTQENLKAFQQEVAKVSEVMECYHLTGPFDFLLRIAVRDMDEYNDVL